MLNETDSLLKAFKEQTEDEQVHMVADSVDQEESDSEGDFD